MSLPTPVLNREQEYVGTLMHTHNPLAIRFTGEIASSARGDIDAPDPLRESPVGRKCYAWSPEEDAAHELFETSASQLAFILGLTLGEDYEFTTDTVGNSFFTVFGSDELETRAIKRGEDKKNSNFNSNTTETDIEETKPIPGIIVGSHLDSTPNGGIYDGVLGVGAGLQAIQTIFAKGNQKPKKSITVVAWRGEESSPHNGVACLGSRIATGQITMAELEKIEYRKDKSGKAVPLVQHLADRNGLKLEDMRKKLEHTLAHPKVTPEIYSHGLELHIEQSAVIDTQGTDLGIVIGGIGGSRREVWNEDISEQVENIDTKGYKKIRLATHGFRGHTGGTPPNPALMMSDLQGDDKMYRRDALVGLGNLIGMLYSDNQSTDVMHRVMVSDIGFAEPLQFTSIPDSAYCDILIPEGIYDEFLAEISVCEGILESELGIVASIEELTTTESSEESVISMKNAEERLSVPMEVYREATEQLRGERTLGHEVGISRITVVDFKLNPKKGVVSFNLDYRHIGGSETFDIIIESVNQFVRDTFNNPEMALKSYGLSESVSTEVYDILMSIAHNKSYNTTSMPSSPGHDVAILGKVGISIGMVFVRHDGVSHNPREHMDPKYFDRPQEVFTDAILHLANS